MYKIYKVKALLSPSSLAPAKPVIGEDATLMLARGNLRLSQSAAIYINSI